MKTIPILAVALCLAGCATPTPNWDMRFGEAVRDARLAMTINPDAGKAPDKNPGIDGRSAALAVTRYQNSFRDPPPPVNVITLGAGAGTPAPR